MRLLFALLLTVTASAQDWAALRTGTDKTIGIKAALPLANIDQAAELRQYRVPNVIAEVAPGGDANAVKAALRRGSVRLAVLSVKTEPDRAVFEWAKNVGVETIVAPAVSPAAQKLAEEFGVKVTRMGEGVVRFRRGDQIDGSRRPVTYVVEPADLEDYERQLTPVMAEYVTDLGRKTPIRRLTVEEDKERIDAAMPAKPQAAPRKARKLLVIDLQVGYPGHKSIPHANYALEKFGLKTGAWQATFSNDLSNFEYEKLKRYDAVFLNNTVGMLFPDPKTRESLLRFVREGGGIAGYHAATHASIDWPELHEMLGASSGAHRDQDEKVMVAIEDPKSPLNASFGGQEFLSVDEHFRWSDYSRQRVHVLLRFDVARTDLNQGSNCGICTRADGDYAISWIREWGKGRVFYTSLGHQPAAFMNPKTLGHILAGVQYALGDLDADAAPGSAPAPEAK